MKRASLLWILLVAPACVKPSVVGAHRATTVFELCQDARFDAMCTPAAPAATGAPVRPIQVDINLSTPPHDPGAAAG